MAMKEEPTPTTVTAEQRAVELEARKRSEKNLEKKREKDRLEAIEKAKARDLFKAEDILTGAEKVYVAVSPELEASFKFSRLNYEETRALNTATKGLEPSEKALKTIAAMVEKAAPELRGLVEAKLRKLTPEDVAVLTDRMNEAAPPHRFLRRPSGTQS